MTESMIQLTPSSVLRQARSRSRDDQASVAARPRHGPHRRPRNACRPPRSRRPGLRRPGRRAARSPVSHEAGEGPGHLPDGRRRRTPGRSATAPARARDAASAAGGRRRAGRRDTRRRPVPSDRPWRGSRRRRPARRCRRARAWRGSCPRCVTVTARAVRHQTRVTSHPVSQRTRSKLCTPVWSRMPPPESSGRSSQSSGEGSKRWFDHQRAQRAEIRQALPQRARRWRSTAACAP